MINVKDQVYQALLGVTENVTDVYPTTWQEFPSIQYTEEANNVITRTDNTERISYLRYRVDIWDKGSTSLTAIAVDDALAPLGLVRTECADTPDPSGLRHKQMRYECEIDVSNEQTYWQGNQ